MDLFEHIAKEINKSNYFLSASGFRDVDFDELVEFVKIIRGHNNFEEKLSNLYKYNPKTILLEKSWRKNNCDKFNENCNCFLPDTDYESFWCTIKRAEQSEESRYCKEYENWRSAVFERDNFTCRKCGVRGGTLNAHHIKSYKDHKSLRLDVDNGLTLCKKCHDEEHYGTD